jgi:uncharacterized protein YdhG (YjbR/CyaY superfamily)
MRMSRKPASIDEYLSELREDDRVALEKLRKTIRSAAPNAEECISYGIPAYKLNGLLVGFGATAKHCAFYAMSATTVAAHADALAGFDTSKGTIRFKPNAPIPVALVRKLVRARVAENAQAD